MVLPVCLQVKLLRLLVTDPFREAIIAFGAKRCCNTGNTWYFFKLSLTRNASVLRGRHESNGRPGAWTWHRSTDTEALLTEARPGDLLFYSRFSFGCEGKHSGDSKRALKFKQSRRASNCRSVAGRPELSSAKLQEDTGRVLSRMCPNLKAKCLTGSSKGLRVWSQSLQLWLKGHTGTNVVPPGQAGTEISGQCHAQTAKPAVPLTQQLCHFCHFPLSNSFKLFQDFPWFPHRFGDWMGDLDPGCVDDDPPTLRFCLKHIVLAIAAGCLGLLWDWLYSSVCSIQHNAWCCFDLSLSHWVLYSCCSMLFKALYITCQTHVESLVMSHSFATRIALWLWFVLIVVAIMLTVLGGCQLLCKFKFLVGSLIAVSAAVNFDCWWWSRLLKASLLSLLSLPCFFCFLWRFLCSLLWLSLSALLQLLVFWIEARSSGFLPICSWRLLGGSHRCFDMLHRISLHLCVLAL